MRMAPKKIEEEDRFSRRERKSPTFDFTCKCLWNKVPFFVIGYIAISTLFLTKNIKTPSATSEGTRILIPSSATADSDIHCVPIQADQFSKQVGRSATFFKGGINTTKWTDMFVPALEQYGWQPESCESATARVMHLIFTDAKTYKNKCGPHNNSGSSSLVFGYPNDYFFSEKKNFVKYVRAYELKHLNKRSNQTSFIPLSYQLADETECQNFFASSDFPDRRWLSKKPMGNKGIEYVSNFTSFRQQYGACKNDKNASIAQELLKPPLWGGKYLWNFRMYLMLVNTDPFVVVRRIGDVLLCTEPYSKINHTNPYVRNRASRCNLHVAKKHPLYGKENGFDANDILMPFIKVATEFGLEVYERIVDGIDEALRTLSWTMEDHFRNNSKPLKDHNVGLYAIDGMVNDRFEVKLLELNTSPQYTDFCRKALVHAISDNNEHFPIEFPRLSLTALAQFGLSNDKFSVDACVNEHPFLKRII